MSQIWRTGIVCVSADTPAFCAATPVPWIITRCVAESAGTSDGSSGPSTITEGSLLRVSVMPTAPKIFFHGPGSVPFTVNVPVAANAGATASPRMKQAAG